jgi:predicted component of type VI protein secretion system
MVSTMRKEMEHLFATRFGTSHPRPGIVQFVCFNRMSLTYEPRIQNAETERKQETAFESYHH